MFKTEVKTKDQAICHLFLHCCYKDGEVNEKEIDYVSGLFVELDLHTTLNFKDESLKYKQYRASITDEVDYLVYLIKLVNPVHELALFGYCVEIVMSDATLDITEEKLLREIAVILQIDEERQSVINKLITQRRAVELQKLF